MPIFALHSLLLLSALTGSYLFLTSPTLSPYTLQLTALLLLLYAVTHWFKKPGRQPLSHLPLDLTLLTMIIVLLVVDTGALTSPIFFLLYFLLFAVALLFEIETTLFLTGSLLTFFLLFPTNELGSFTYFSELIGLICITPLALYTGHEYELMLSERRRREKITKDLAAEETDTLFFLSTNLKSTLTSALDRLSILIPQHKLNSLRPDLELLYSDLRALYLSAEELKETIDHQTD